MDKILDYIKADTLVLTPNRRLSAWLHKYHNQQQMLAGKTTWERADIIPFNSWIAQLWDEYSYTSLEALPLLLTAAQEHFLWESIISSTHDDALLQVSKTAELAKSAWVTLKQWELTTDDPLFSSSDDYTAFHGWADAYVHKCKVGNWTDSTAIIETIINCIKQSKLRLKNNIILCGFNEISPLMNQLLDACKDKGIIIQTHNIDNHHQQHFQATFKSQEDEFTTAARWCKQITLDNPGASIGIVIPTLERSYNHVNRLFKDVFANATNINITAGKQLSNYPIIRTALNILDLKKPLITQDAFSDILTSPFIGNADSEHIKRSRFDAYLRRENIDTINITSLLQPNTEINNALTQYCPKLFKQLMKWQESLGSAENKHTYTEWANIFSQSLHALGWPGERSLNSEEFQIVDKWFELLNELSKLDYITTSVSYKVATSTLQMLAAKQLFQAKSPEANIQIMGALEAASIPFDYLWVTGMNDITWPSQPSPNPFIPPRIQREHNMPHATSDRELEYCESMTAQFIRSSKYAIFSYAHLIDNIEVSQSPIIKDFPAINSLPLADFVSTNEKILASSSVELFKDVSGPMLIPEEMIYGGVTVLKDQALCPFKAFATWRLHAHTLEEPVPGLSKRERGTIIHKVIELAWGKLSSQQALASLADDDLKSLIMSCIDTVTQTSRAFQNQGMQYIEIEKARLLNLIHQWLQTEKQRPAFKTDTLEKTADISIGRLKLKTRVDRVDTLDNGDKLLIDYKTGSNLDINSWFSDRPEEPQLPIYALNTPSIAGISYAQLYLGKLNFVGIAKYDLEIEGIKSIEKLRNAEAGWNEQIGKWETSLNTIADEFADGHASVRPKHGLATCEWCNLKPLCRYHSVNGQIENE